MECNVNKLLRSYIIWVCLVGHTLIYINNVCQERHAAFERLISFKLRFRMNFLFLQINFTNYSCCLVLVKRPWVAKYHCKVILCWPSVMDFMLFVFKT